MSQTVGIYFNNIPNNSPPYGKQRDMEHHNQCLHYEGSETPITIIIAVYLQHFKRY